MRAALALCLLFGAAPAYAEDPPPEPAPTRRYRATLEERFREANTTGDGRLKPDLVAPGERIASCAAGAAVTKLFPDGPVPPKECAVYVEDSGTSMAAPMVTGALAMVLAEARRQGVDLDIDRLRHLVMATGRPAASGSGWDSRYGHGKLSVAAMLQQLSDAPKVAAASGRRQRRRTSSRSA